MTTSLIVNISIFTLIIVSTVGVCIDSIKWIHDSSPIFFKIMELVSSILFSIEYICRLLSVKRFYCYAISFGGVVDLASSIPALFGMLMPDLFNLMVFR